MHVIKVIRFDILRRRKPSSIHRSSFQMKFIFRLNTKLSIKKLNYFIAEAGYKTILNPTIKL